MTFSLGRPALVRDACLAQAATGTLAPSATCAAFAGGASTLGLRAAASSVGMICFFRESTPGSTAVCSLLTVHAYACSTIRLALSDAEMKVASSLRMSTTKSSTCRETPAREEQGGRGMRRYSRGSSRAGLGGKHVVQPLLFFELGHRLAQRLQERGGGDGGDRRRSCLEAAAAR